MLVVIYFLLQTFVLFLSRDLTPPGLPAVAPFSPWHQQQQLQLQLQQQQEFMLACHKTLCSVVCNVLLHVLSPVPNSSSSSSWWPIEIVEAYLFDSCANRLWVDDPVNYTFLQNILTVFQPQPDSNNNNSTSKIRPRFSDDPAVQQKVKNDVLNIVNHFLSNTLTATAATSNGNINESNSMKQLLNALKLIVVTCAAYKEVALLATHFLHSWIRDYHWGVISLQQQQQQQVVIDMGILNQITQAIVNLTQQIGQQQLRQQQQQQLADHSNDSPQAEDVSIFSNLLNCYISCLAKIKGLSSSMPATNVSNSNSVSFIQAIQSSLFDTIATFLKTNPTHYPLIGIHTYFSRSCCSH
jgi:hypothetical protein